MFKRRRVNPTTIFDPVHREYELGPEIVDIINTAKKMEINTYLMEQNKSIIDLFPDIIQQAHH